MWGMCFSFHLRSSKWYSLRLRGRDFTWRCLSSYHSSVRFLFILCRSVVNSPVCVNRPFVLVFTNMYDRCHGRRSKGWCEGVQGYGDLKEIHTIRHLTYNISETRFKVKIIKRLRNYRYFFYLLYITRESIHMSILFVPHPRPFVKLQ